MQITLIFQAFFEEAEKTISGGSTTKFILYAKKRLHENIGAYIRPATINTLSDLTIWLGKGLPPRDQDKGDREGIPHTHPIP